MTADELCNWPVEDLDGGRGATWSCPALDYRPWRQPEAEPVRR